MDDVNEQAEDRLDQIIEQMEKAEGITEELKASDQMAINSIRNRAEKNILAELIYN